MSEIIPVGDAVEIEQPQRGTLGWLAEQGTTERNGEAVPACHRIPEDATLSEDTSSTKCRVILASGERCKGTRLKAYGLCMGHAGGGGTVDPASMSAKASAKLRSLRVTREVLGIGPRTAANPRAAMRIRAAQRAADYVSAVVDAPLDDRKLSSVERQVAALKALDAAFPIQATTVSLQLDDSSDLDDMDWKSMQALAASLLS